MKILLFGANGQLGRRLSQTLASLGPLVAVDRRAVDITDHEAVRAMIHIQAPDVIVNAAAYTAVDAAESDTGAAMAANAQAPAAMSAEASLIGAWYVHYSTDYVFDGSSSLPYRESDPVNPVNVYGRSKAIGEQEVRDNCASHLILRSSWIYDAHGANFANTILDLAARKSELKVISDSFGAPTSASLLAISTFAALYRIRTIGSGVAKLAGTYHVCASGQTTWHAYAQFLIKEATALGHGNCLPVHQIHPVSAADYKSAARRPHNSRLDCSKFEQTFSVTMPDWTLDAYRFVEEYVATERRRPQAHNV